MTDAMLDRLVDRLWDKGPDPVFAILDGAVDPDVHPTVVGSGLPHACLFSGDLKKDLAQAAPYLVELARPADATRQILKRGWDKSWGIFLASPASLEDLRRHLRRFLRVKDAKGKTLYFRYYDPRVLRVYLPTCDEAELKVIFGPVARYALPGEDPAQMIVYRRAGPELSVDVVELR